MTHVPIRKKEQINYRKLKSDMAPMTVRFVSLLLGYILASLYCHAQQGPSTGKRLFQTGFEGSSRVLKLNGTNDHGAPMEYIDGVDTSFSANSNWRTDWQRLVKSGRMQVQYTGGDSTKRLARVMAEPGNPKNHVLHYWLNDSWAASENQQKARIQTNLYGINGGLTELYQSVRVFLTDDFNALKTYPRAISWCTISEFWNNEWWVKGEPYGFRITLGIGKASGPQNELKFILNAENAGQKEVWHANSASSTVAVPIGRWFTMEYYLKEGNRDTGRFFLAITPDGQPRQVVYDITNFTHNTTDPSPNGITGYNPMKLYTSKELVNHVRAQGKTLQVYWDDFTLWTDKQPD
ncbi:hypothetical protein [Spirosoma sordidisoli]|uniref:Polysaccharide lyase-like protein n=1 Tax=Spirosoma sordidisoli TaxID=2502893 RepID=A0A4Q2UNF8_9BACT|nr:hypothetical protein [Spirosoma sordidisoli]RYC70954.1 hypothetical protein EQG79_02045 [Spirosoma sordidisoli]